MRKSLCCHPTKVFYLKNRQDLLQLTVDNLTVCESVDWTREVSVRSAFRDDRTDACHMNLIRRFQTRRYGVPNHSSWELFVAPCKVGFHAVDSGFQVLVSSLCQRNLDSEFQGQISIVSGIPDSLSCIPDSTSKNFTVSGISYTGRSLHR